MVEFVVPAEQAGERLDVVLARRAGISRALAVRLIVADEVTVDGTPAGKSMRVTAGMWVRARLPAAEEPSPPRAEAIDIHVVFEDEWLMVVSKPAGLVVHPAPGHAEGTLVNALLARSTPAGGAVERPGIVHRLDAGTSGLMIVAKDEEAHERLVEQMAARAITRVYLTLVEGNPDSDSATIDAPIGRSPKHRKRMAVVAGGRAAVTRITVLERFIGTALLEARPHTGRTHQIRVHLAAAGYPVVGDDVYGRNRGRAASLGLSRPFLHAARLSFVHPMTGEQIDIEDPLPPDLAEVLARVRAPG